MTTELTVELMCIVMRNGVQIWAEKERVKKLMILFGGQNAPQFIEYDGRFLNRADLVGVFNAKDMEDMQHHKNGDTQCQWGFWHGKNEKCHNHQEYLNLPARDQRCRLCTDGFLVVDNGDAKKCSCWFN